MAELKFFHYISFGSPFLLQLSSFIESIKFAPTTFEAATIRIVFRQNEIPLAAGSRVGLLLFNHLSIQASQIDYVLDLIQFCLDHPFRPLRFRRLSWNSLNTQAIKAKTYQIQMVYLGNSKPEMAPCSKQGRSLLHSRPEGPCFNLQTPQKSVSYSNPNIA